MENLIELKKIAKEVYEKYILLFDCLENNDRNTVNALINSIKSSIEEEKDILSLLDYETLYNLFVFANQNLDEENKGYIYKLYFFIINYCDEKFIKLVYNDDILDVRKNAYAYSFKKMFEVIENDTLALKDIDNAFYEKVRKFLHLTLFSDIMLFPKLEELFLNANFNFNNIVIEDYESENNKKECMNVILYAETLNNKAMTADNVVDLLKRKYLFEYLVQNLSKEDYLDIKNYLFSINQENNLIIEFKKVIEEKEKNDKRGM